MNLIPSSCDCPYTILVTAIETSWPRQKIEIFHKERMIGTFERNYGSYGESTFVPFYQKGSWYALCSPDLEGLSVMKLPECTILGHEESDFCAVEVFVPRYQWEVNSINFSREKRIKRYEKAGKPLEKEKETFYENTAFVSGCVWGDDSSWKIELRDISKAHRGIIKDIPEWGYNELPELPLRECIELHGCEELTDDPKDSIHASVKVIKAFQFKKNLKTNDHHFFSEM